MEIEDRTCLSQLLDMVDLGFRRPELGRTEFEDEAYRRNDLIIYRPREGKNSYVGLVNCDDIFDRNGNRFFEDE